MRNECKVLVRIKKGYGWQLEEHPKIAGSVSLLGSSGWDQGGSRGWSHSSCSGKGGWGQPALQGDGTFLFCLLAAWAGREAQWGCIGEDSMSHRAPKIVSPCSPLWF